MADIYKNGLQTDKTATKAYAAPKLEVFGEVAALTAGGSGMAIEGTNDTSTTKTPMA